MKVNSILYQNKVSQTEFVSMKADAISFDNTFVKFIKKNKFIQKNINCLSPI